ncbi:MAG: hypothetical protein AAF546_14190, partial [Verrucomicrobiota bacterium]
MAASHTFQKTVGWIVPVLIGFLVGLVIEPDLFTRDKNDAPSSRGFEKAEGKNQSTPSSADDAQSLETIILPLSKSELEAISLRELSTSATTFSTASPVEYAFVNHADRATVERITSEY